MTYGPAIECNGDRPEWLGDDDVVYWGGLYHAKQLDWEDVGSFQLPAEHPYYRATDAGFKYWPGGDSAPEDWDSGMVLFRNDVKQKTAPGFVYRWHHKNWSGDIIGYHTKPEAAEATINPWPSGMSNNTLGVALPSPPAIRPKDLRDEYAMHIAAGILAHEGMWSDSNQLADNVFKIADAMTLAREVGR